MPKKKKSIEDDILGLYKQVRTRQRPRSTTFADGVDKWEKRQNRRQNDKDFINDEIELFEELDEEFGLFEEAWNE
jgi:hypothetical protein